MQVAPQVLGGLEPQFVRESVHGHVRKPGAGERSGEGVYILQLERRRRLGRRCELGHGHLDRAEEEGEELHLAHGAGTDKENSAARFGDPDHFGKSTGCVRNDRDAELRRGDIETRVRQVEIRGGHRAGTDVGQSLGARSDREPLQHRGCDVNGQHIGSGTSSRNAESAAAGGDVQKSSAWSNAHLADHPLSDADAERGGELVVAGSGRVPGAANLILGGCLRGHDILQMSLGWVCLPSSTRDRTSGFGEMTELDLPVA